MPVPTSTPHTTESAGPAGYLPFATTAIAFLGATVVAVLVHRLSKRREAAARLAAVAAKFRATIESLVVQVPPSAKHWDNKLLSGLQSMVSSIGIAVAEFSPFLQHSDRKRFQAEWLSFARHCEQGIPQSLSAHEILYGGGTPVALGSKEKFHAHVQALLSYAQQT